MNLGDLWKWVRGVCTFKPYQVKLLSHVALERSLEEQRQQRELRIKMDQLQRKLNRVLADDVKDFHSEEA